MPSVAKITIRDVGGKGGLTSLKEMDPISVEGTRFVRRLTIRSNFILIVSTFYGKLFFHGYPLIVDKKYCLQQIHI
jgi:hypothetical protein